MPGRVRHVIYLAAHGGFDGQAVPLGGGAAIAASLAAEWQRTRPFSDSAARLARLLQPA